MELEIYIPPYWISFPDMYSYTLLCSPHLSCVLRYDKHKEYSWPFQELKDLRATLLEDFTKQQEELRTSLSIKEKELEASAALCVQQDSSIEVLKQRLASAAQSRVDAEEVIDR